MSQTQTILATTVYGQASGNYDGSSQDWYSDPAQAADYYRGRGGLQTVTFSLDGFQGIIKLQATLDTLPETAKWFDVYEIGDGIVPLTDYHPESITGNFVWMRVNVLLFDSGTINSVTITY
jgi:hypothetical protein